MGNASGSEGPDTLVPTMGPVPLTSHEDRSGHCLICLMGVPGPLGQWATCPQCSGAPLDELVDFILSDLPTLDETDRAAVVNALLPLLSLLASRASTL